MGHKRGYWNELADDLAHVCCSAFMCLLVFAAILLMFFAGKADYPLDELLYGASLIAAVFATMFSIPMAFKIVAPRLDARRTS